MKNQLLSTVALAAVAAGAWPNAALADPVFVPLLTSLAVAANASVPAGLISIGSAILTTALGVGLSMLLTQKPAKPENGSLALQQTIPPRIFGYGMARIAGYVVLEEETGGVLCQVQALVGHEITSFEQIFLNTDAVTFPTGTSGYVNAGSDGRYGSNVILIDHRSGLATETAYSGIAALMPASWTADHRGDGVASLSMVCLPQSQSKFSKVYPNQKPAPSAVMKLYKVFDPRDESQSPTDPSTWKWSDNPALCILHFECFSEYGPKRPYDRAIAPVLSEWIEEINICDEDVDLKGGGTERRYRLGGFQTTDQDQRTARQAMLAACDGWFIERGDGTCILKVGKYREPTVTITDDDIAGWFIQSNAANEDRAERMSASYTFPAGGYVSVETDSIDLDNGDLPIDQARKSQNDLTWVQSTGQASRLLKRQAIKYATPVRGKLTLRLSGINALYERWIRVQSSIPRLNDVVIENRLPRLSLMSGQCTLEFIGSGAEVDAYDPETDESQAPTAVYAATSDGPYVPTSVVAVTEEREEGDGSSSIYVDLSWDAPVVGGVASTFYDYRVRWRLHDVGGSPGSWSDNLVFTQPPFTGTTITVSVFGLAQDASIDMQVSSVSPGGTQSDWSSSVLVSTERTFAAPASPLSLTASGGSGTASLSCTNPNSAIFAGVKFYRAPSGSPFSGATNVGGIIYGPPNGTSSYVDTGLSSGSYDYWATSVNAAPTPAESSPTGPQTATVT